MSSFNEIAAGYQSVVNLLIDNLGKDVTLYFKKQITNIDETFIDNNMPGGIKKPFFKENAPSVTQETRTIKANIVINPKEFKYTELSLNKPNGIVRLKTKMQDVADLMRCEYIVVNSDSSNVIMTKYKLIFEPFQYGLVENAFAISYWERI